MVMRLGLTGLLPVRERNSGAGRTVASGMADAEAEAGVGLAAQVVDQVADVDLLFGRHPGPGAVHLGPQAHGLVGVALAVLDEGQELAGEGEVLLLRVEEGAPEGPAGGPVRRDR